jgi:recombination protein RecT
MNEISKTEGKQSVMPKTVKSWLSSDYFKTQVALCLPKHLTADRFVRVAITALTRIPKLAECTPESVIKCMMSCSELGIEPDGRRAHLIPYGKECTLILDYKGLVELAKRSGDVSNIHAQIVCEQDFFEYDTGEITHKIDFRKDRGAMYAAYAVITFKDGSKHTEVMNKVEIDAIRKRSRAGGNGPWVTDYNEMAKKTVFRRASKWVTLSPEIQDALDKDADALAAPGGAALVSEAALSLPGEEPAPDANTVPVEVAVVSDPAQPKEKPAKVESESQALGEIVTSAGHDFDTFRKWGDLSGNIENADSLGSFDEVPVAVAKRLLRAKTGLLQGLERVKKGEAL